MSKENVKFFYEAPAKDKALQGKAQAIVKKYEGQKPDEKQMEGIYQKELVPLAKEAGYSFTLAELKAYASEIKKPAMREVSEEELAAVAGGKFCACAFFGSGNLTGTGEFSYAGQCDCAGYGMGNLDGGKMDCVCVAGGGGG